MNRQEKTGASVNHPNVRGWAVNIIFLVGMAGSGKSSLTGAFHEWLKLNEQNSITVNLDPGVTNLPYNPDVDIRDYISLEAIMEEYQLGPNGGLILAADLIGDNIEEVRESIEEISPDIVLVDTPGQIELFALRESGPFITRSIAECPKAVVYLFDGPFSSKPLNYVSNMYLAATVYSRLLQPQVYALTKVDLLEEASIGEITGWMNPQRLIETLDKTQSKTASLVSRDLARAISRTQLNFKLIPVSSKTNEGFIDLNAALTRILTGGEELRP
ncbi:MAG: ATP/GTP-binding protein [Candidatus Bathyarchaeia archaeon]|nr:ATP/GTP-binding protein [Candidatus Bathyarchaeota archaeon]